jgi:hypothetical protein
MTLGFLDCSLAGAAASLASNRALHLATIACARQYTADNITSGSQQASRGPGGRRLKSRHIAVPASVAIELVLIPAIGGEILMIGGEIDKTHNTRMLLVCQSMLPR